MKKTITPLLLATSLSLLAACATKPVPVAPGYKNDNFDNDIPKNEVPEVVLSAAKAQIPGFLLQEADLQQRSGHRLYELQGRANGRRYEMDILPDGRVLHVERD
jgi:hypothetical protein